MTGWRRRDILAMAGALGVSGCTPLAWINPCPEEPLPPELRHHPLVTAAWTGLEPALLRDCHVHLLGNGDSRNGIHLHPHMQQPIRHPWRYLKMRAFLTSACAEGRDGVDQGYLSRLDRQLADFPVGFKLLLLAFDQVHDLDGRPRLDLTDFQVPDATAAAVANSRPDRLEWAASVHPHRPDWEEALHVAADQGARAIKWLPPAMGMDPASPRHDPFYRTMAALGLPLLTHGGDEKSVHGVDLPELGNPLRLRRALGHGVRVIVAHCASLGEGIDLDRGENAATLPNYQLFFRMLAEPAWRNLLFGDISGVFLRNRSREFIQTLLERSDCHSRLLYGSDYPLPGVFPVFNLPQLAEWGLLTQEEAAILIRIRHYNPLLFAFILARTVRWQGQGLATTIFTNRDRLRS